MEPVPASAGHDEASFSVLPPELTQLIFWYLSTRDLLETVPRVCRRWRLICQVEFLWRDFRLSGMDVPTEVVVDRLGRTPRLKRLTLRKRIDANRVLDAVARSCPLLDTLQMEMVHFCPTQDTVDLLVRNCPLLRVVNLRSITGVQGKKHLLDHFSRFQNLESLTLHGLSQPAAFCGREWTCPKLTSLTLMEIKSRHQVSDTRALLNKAGPQLSCLTVSWWTSSCMFPLLVACSGLEHLTIINARMMLDDGLLDGVGRLTNLRTLSITGASFVSRTALLEMLSRAHVVQGLERLELVETQLDDRCLDAIAINCVKLHALVVSYSSRLSGAGLKRLMLTIQEVKVQGAPFAFKKELEHFGISSGQLRID